ncbi:9482_t:CDS:2, partial [Entrophospora sp. SA101]
MSSIGRASTTENISPNSSPNEDLSNERKVLLTSQDTPSIESEQKPINQDISEAPINQAP